MQYGSGVRWDDLFAALESEAESLSREIRDADIADRTRSAQAQTSWLMRCRGAELTLRVQGAGAVRGTVVTVTPAWLLVRDGGPVDLVVSTSAVTTVGGLSETVSELGARTERMGWTHAWRVLSRDRSDVRITCTDATVVRGVAEVVGRDYVSLRPYDAGRPSGAAAVAVPYDAIATVACPR